MPRQEGVDAASQSDDMILTCPSCATSYFTPDGAIGAQGRKVRCQSCAHVWHATPDEEPLHLTASAPGGSKTEFGKRDEAAETLAETPAPELPKAYRAKQEQQRRLRKAATHGAIWAGLASVFIGLIASAMLFRVEVVDLWPRAAAAYAMVGAPVNPTGLDFEAMSARPDRNAPLMVMVSGALRNVRDKEVVAPPVRVALLDQSGGEIGFKIIRIDAAPVLPGGVQGFAALIPDPSGKAAGVGVDFVTGSPAAESHEENHEPAPTRSVRRPPVTEAHEAGLRPALGDDIGASHGAPLEAQAVAVEHGPDHAALDSHPVEAVSAPDHG